MKKETNRKITKTKNEFNIRFENILRLLKEKDAHNTQISIIEKINLDFINDESYFSDLKSGKRKKIPEKLIKALHEHYNINPDYLRAKSDCPFDDADFKLESFLNFVNDWNVLNSNDNKDKYLHLTFDRNFYDFLIDFNRAIEITEEGFSSIEQEKKALEELYFSEPSPKEFVLIPRNNFMEIVNEAIEDHKKISEVINLIEYSSYGNTVTTDSQAPKENAKRLKIILKQSDRKNKKGK